MLSIITVGLAFCHLLLESVGRVWWNEQIPTGEGLMSLSRTESADVTDSCPQQLERMRE